MVPGNPQFHLDQGCSVKNNFQVDPEPTQGRSPVTLLCFKGFIWKHFLLELFHFQMVLAFKLKNK